MTSKTNGGIRWTRHKKIEEFLDDPLVEEIYGLFLQVKDSPRHIAIKAENLLNEVFYICSRFYQDNNPEEHLGEYAQEIESDLGWHYASDLVMVIAYVVLGNRSRIPQKIQRIRQSIKFQYQHIYYWDVFCEREYRVARKKPVKVINLQDLAKMTDKTIVIQVNNADINVNSPGNQIIQQQKNGYIKHG
jgi:hypothetical protein